jgi:hypothetical protein
MVLEKLGAVMVVEKLGAVMVVEKLGAVMVVEKLGDKQIAQALLHFCEGFIYTQLDLVRLSRCRHILLKFLLLHMSATG